MTRQVTNRVEAFGPGWALMRVVVDGVPQLIDIYMGKEWIGSRRTVEQCYKVIGSHGGEVPGAYRYAKPE